MTDTTGIDAISAARDFDLELVEHRTLDRDAQKLICRPTLERTTSHVRGQRRRGDVVTASS